MSRLMKRWLAPAVPDFTEVLVATVPAGKKYELLTVELRHPQNLAGSYNVRLVSAGVGYPIFFQPPGGTNNIVEFINLGAVLAESGDELRVIMGPFGGTGRYLITYMDVDL